MAKTNARTTPRDRRAHKLVRHFSMPFLQLERDLETLTDDELDAMAGKIKATDQTNCWYVTYNYRHAILQAVREVQASRARARARVQDEMDQH